MFSWKKFRELNLIEIIIKLWNILKVVFKVVHKILKILCIFVLINSFKILQEFIKIDIHDTAL